MGAFYYTPSRDEDDEYDKEVARELAEDFDKRAASGMSAELLSLQDARIAGAKAGQQGQAFEMNPYHPDSPEWTEWRKAFQQGLASRLAGSFC